MRLFRNISEFKTARFETSVTVGVCPTMGNLHQGHLSLIESSYPNNDLTVMTIFVNPLQFGEGEDFKSYPRTLEVDLEKIQKLENRLKEKYPNKEIWVLAPKESIFPPGFSTKVIIDENQDILCGIDRPGHFDGVTTVVHKIFDLVKPDRGYFGKKDYQQLWLIQKMVTDLDMPIEIIGQNIARDPDGLAMSSRNNYLSIEEREKALILPKTLNQIAQQVENSSLNDEILQNIETLKKEYGFIYLDIRNQKTLKPALVSDKNLIVLGGLRVGKTRIIDNREINI